MRSTRFVDALGYSLVQWSRDSSHPEPVRLKAVVLHLREKVGVNIAESAPPQQFEAAVARLIERGADSLRSREDMLLAARLTSASETLDGDSVAARDQLLRPLLERWELRMNRAFLSPILWHSAFGAYFHADSESSRHLLRSFLKRTLAELPTGLGAPQWVDVVQRHSRVIGSNPTTRYAADWLEESESDMEELRTHAKLPVSSWFWSSLLDEILRQLDELGDARFAQRLQSAIELSKQHPQHSDKVLAALLDRYARSQAPVMHEGLVQELLTRWGNPHLDQSDRSFLWSQVSNTAVQMVLRWLAEEDLADFFELIKTTSSQLTEADVRRFEYWKRYTGRMQFTRLVLGVGYRDGVSKDIERFIAKRRSRLGWLHGPNPMNIAILMKIEDHWFVEFSQTGNACFPYRDDRRPFDLKKKDFNLYDLKNQRAVEASGLSKLLHLHRWEERFDRELAELGIWPAGMSGGRRASRSVPVSIRVTESGELALIVSGPLLKELEGLKRRIVDNRGVGGAYWVELNSEPSLQLIQEMKVAGYRHVSGRGFYR